MPSGSEEACGRTLPLAPGFDAPALARAFAREASEANLAHDELERVVLLVSELVADSMRSICSAMELAVTPTASGVLVELHDLASRSVLAPSTVVDQLRRRIIDALVDGSGSHYGPSGRVRWAYIAAALQ